MRKIDKLMIAAACLLAAALAVQLIDGPDHTKPTVSIKAKDDVRETGPGEVMAGKRVSLVGTIDDDHLDAVSVRVDGNLVADAQEIGDKERFRDSELLDGPLFFNTAGKHTISVTASDRNGNTRTRKITVTAIAPDLASE